MKKFTVLFLFSVFAWGICTHADPYVRKDNGTTAVAPYASWQTAATNIADALQFAEDGSTLWVDDGHYLLDQELVVSNQITIRSVNGPDAAIIDGQGSVRCFNLRNSACVLNGLTITNGNGGDYGRGAGVV